MIKQNKKKTWKATIILKKIADKKVRIQNKILAKKHSICQKKFYELTYIIEDYQQRRLSELAESFRKRNGWSEKEMLQFAVTATNQIDLDTKFRFLESILADLESEEQASK